MIMHTIRIVLLVLLLTQGIHGGPFASTDISFVSTAASGTLTLYGTLTTPSNLPSGAKIPGVLLLAGSGGQDRDETNVFSQWGCLLSPPATPGCQLYSATVAPLKDIAETLSQNGFAVLRYDKRGCQYQSFMPSGRCNYTICTANITTNCVNFYQFVEQDFIVDAQNALAYMVSLGFVDPTDLTVLGHSEGASLVGYVATNFTSKPSFTVTRLGLMMGSGLSESLLFTLELVQANAAALGVVVQSCVNENQLTVAATLRTEILNYQLSLGLQLPLLNALLNTSSFNDSDLVLGLPALQWYSIYAVLNPDSVRAALVQFLDASPDNQILIFNSPQDPLITPSNYAPLHMMGQGLSQNGQVTVLEIDNLIHYMTPSDLSSAAVSPVVTDTILNFVGVSSASSTLIPIPWFAVLVSQIGCLFN